ncbi:MAG TPA: CHAD domain-containing protein [Dokdonella sp.]
MTVPTPTPRRSARPAPGAVLRAGADAELEHAIAGLGRRGARVHEGVHLARKSLRRTRAVLALGRPALGAGADWIDSGIRAVNRALSPLRDAQALVEALDRLIDTETDDDALRRLRRARRHALAARTQHAQRAQRDALLADARATLVALRAALAALPWSAVTAAGVERALRRSAAHVDAAAARVRERGRATDWHRWRRRARRLSQQQTALGGLGRTSEADRRRLKKLATLLGEAQDYAMLHRRLRGGTSLADADRDALRALGAERLRRLRRRIGRIATRPR